MAALKDASWSVRRAAAEALGQIGDPRAAEPLKAAFEDSDSNVRRAATDALAALGWRPKVSQSGSPGGRTSATVREQ
jgi:HEAT repeat protein